MDYYQGLGAVSKGTDPESGGYQPWQADLARLARTNGLLRFAIAIVADTGSRVRLLPERFNPATGQWEEGDSELANIIVSSWRGRYGSQASTLWTHLWHRRTVGERFQVREVVDGKVFFTPYAPSAIERRGDSYAVKESPSDTGRLLPKEAVTRMWWPDPEWPRLPYSPLAAGLTDVKRYTLLGRVIDRTAASALLARGILWMSTEAVLARGAAVQTPGEGSQALPPLLKDYYDAAQATLGADDLSVAGVTPFLLHSPNGAGEPKLIQFGSPFDGQLLPLRREALEAFARAADLPSSLVINGGAGSGTGDMGGNHISDLLVDRRFFDTTVAGQVEAVLHDLTLSILQPALSAAMQSGAFTDNPAMWRIGYDPSPVVLPPDKSRNALEAFRTGLISIEAAVTALGFSMEDIPSAEELRSILEILTSVNQGYAAGDAARTPGSEERGVQSMNGQGTMVDTRP